MELNPKTGKYKRMRAYVFRLAIVASMFFVRVHALVVVWPSSSEMFMAQARQDPFVPFCALAKHHGAARQVGTNHG